MAAHTLIQKLSNYCNILRDDGLSCGDYVEQLTFLVFLKMAEEQARPPFNKPSPVPLGKDWPALLAKDGDELEIHYRHTLEELGKRPGMLGVIFRKAQNKIQDPGFCVSQRACCGLCGWALLALLSEALRPA